MERALVFTSLLALAFSSCAYRTECHLTDHLGISQGSSHLALDLLSPQNNLIFQDATSYYILAPLVEYTPHLPVLSMTPLDEPSPGPQVREVQSRNAHLLVQLTPAQKGMSAKIKVWGFTPGSQADVVRSDDGMSADIHMSAQAKKHSLKGLKTSLTNKTDLSSFLSTHGFAHYASLGATKEGWKKFSSYVCVPLVPCAALMDYVIATTVDAGQAVVMAPLQLGKAFTQGQEPKKDQKNEASLPDLFPNDRVYMQF